MIHTQGMNVKYGVYGGRFGLKWALLIHTIQLKELKNISKTIKRCTGSLSITPNGEYMRSWLILEHWPIKFNVL